MTFISIHSVIIYVVFFGACMRCTRLCSLKPGVTCYKWYQTRSCGFMGVCGLGVPVYGARRMWARSGHMAWHMTTLDTQTWLRGEVPILGLIDEDVNLLRGWIVISWPLGWWYPCLRFNRINRVSILTRCIFFFGNLSRKNLQVKHAWLGAI
jgi:hypothetical protein